MTIEISPKCELYAVHVSETLTAEETIMVVADSPEEAQKIARRHVNFDTYCDFESDGVETWITRKNPPVESLEVYDYIVVNGCEYNMDQFLEEFLGTEEWERLRIAEIERDNGQIALEL